MRHKTVSNIKGKGMDPEYSLPKLKCGLEALENIWAAGHGPTGFRLHYYLTWYLLFEGNFSGAMKRLGMDRNTTVYFFKTTEGITRSLPLRKYWARIKAKHPETAFHVKLAAFWDSWKFKPILTPSQHQALVELWKTGFPHKMVRASFWLWAHRSGKSKEWIMGKLGIQHRNSYFWSGRHYKKPASMTYHWFAPFHTTPRDWYPSLKPGRPRKRVD